MGASRILLCMWASFSVIYSHVHIKKGTLSGLRTVEVYEETQTIVTVKFKPIFCLFPSIHTQAGQ